jgi:hypothetical protein
MLEGVVASEENLPGVHLTSLQRLTLGSRVSRPVNVDSCSILS